MANLDLNAVADKLATLDIGTWEIGGQMQPVSMYSEVSGQVQVPAVAIELDDVSYDLSMGGGADGATFLAHLIVSEADTGTGQRLTRQLLSNGSVATSIKAALEQDTTLDGLVSYAHMTGTRSIGSINYAGTEYVGATLVIEVMS